MPRASFPGFPRELPAFLAELRRNNRKDWFDAHRDEYEASYVGPARAFVAAIAPALAQHFPAIRAEPRINGSIMRIHRDVRFSKDKRPYKDGLHFTFRDGGTKQSPGFFLRIAADSFGLAGGLFAFSPEQLERYRKALLDEGASRELHALLERLERGGVFELRGQHYKRVPHGFDAGHPNAELLKHRGLYAALDGPLPDELFGPRAVRWCVGHFRKLQPLEHWIGERVA